ncbi:hypothetical protein ILUMI_12510 [Ignelater luminosus]|uniref:DDE-1 domain-containing protein n=1 Tax=Ignelater luminosus TaxID=2038154 RepID=A0A8K0G6P6_IGNLU|nr:hypothetical protein ILUMI_12510 [Ignelater luminosus]
MMILLIPTVVLIVINNDETYLGNKVSANVREAVAEICQNEEEPQEDAVTEKTKDTIPVQGIMDISSTPGPSSLSVTTSHASPFGRAEAKPRPKESEQDFVSMCKSHTCLMSIDNTSSELNLISSKDEGLAASEEVKPDDFALVKVYDIAKGNSFRRYVAKILFTDKERYGIFFDKLKQVLERYKSTAREMFNLDETGTSTVSKVQKVLSKKGAKQMSQVASTERRGNVTQVGIITATDNALPPNWLFPMIRYDASRMLTSEGFLQVLTFFPALLIIDNQESRLSVEALDFAKENRIVVLTLPSHASNKLQPLDKTVFGSLKKSVASTLKRATFRWPAAIPGLLSPEDIHPYLKGQAWKESNRGRPKGRCTTATDTPEKMLIEEKTKKKMPIKRRLFEEKYSIEKEDNFSVHGENSEIG